MQVVINIDDNFYKRAMVYKGEQFPDNDDLLSALITAVNNGVPLPKKHGRLIDANRLRSMYSINRANFNTVVGIQKWIDEAPTIIEADRSEAE